jgi:hypothetical protein
LYPGNQLLVRRCAGHALHLSLVQDIIAPPSSRLLHK